jgi:uncharacterized membrane protein
MSEVTDGDAALCRRVAAVVERRDALVPLIDAVADSVAAEIGFGAGSRWRAVAAALASADPGRAVAAAGTDPGAWLPLFPASAAGAAHLPRLLAEARRPLLRAGRRWSPLAYPLFVFGVATLVLVLLSITVMPAFRKPFDDFGLELPPVTQIVLGIGWPAATLGGLALLAGWQLAVWRSPGGPAVTAGFTHALAGLVAGGVPADEAVALAARGVGVAWPSRGKPPPLSHAARAALALPPATAGRVLEAVAACHEDRTRWAAAGMAWFVGPVLVGVMGVLVGLITAALFAPVIKLVVALS